MTVAKLIVSTIFLLFCVKLNGQSVTRRVVKIGDQCPDVEIGNIINYPKEKVKISSFRGKLLILDFWATWCNPCLQEFKKNDSIQKKFKGKVEILPVSYESKDIVKRFLDKMYLSTKILPASATNDRVLRSMFVHTTVPHYVWIDEVGKVIGITDRNDVNYDNILRYISGEEYSMQLKEDTVKLIDNRRPLFVLGSEVTIGDRTGFQAIDNSNVLFNSALTGFIDHVGAGVNSNNRKFTARNQTIAKLYKYALGRLTPDFIPSNRVIFDIKDSSVFMKCTFLENYKMPYSEWRRQNTYCYEIQHPPDGWQEKRWNIMKDDIDRYLGDQLGITAILEKRRVRCLVLKRSDESKLTISKDTIVDLKHNSYYFLQKNKPVSNFLFWLKVYYLQHLPTPILDETSLTQPIDLEINCSLSSVTKLNMELEKHGLKFLEEDRLIDVIVIKDRR